MTAILDQARIVYGYNPISLAYEPLTVMGGSVSIGTVNQGTAGSSPWRVRHDNDLTPSSPAAATVGVTSAAAVSANVNRRGLILVNTSTATISIAFGTAAVLNSGITLTPGGVYNMDEWSFDTGEVRAIASAASSNLAIQEFT